MADNVQRLIFDILTRDRASEGFAKAGHAAQSAAGDVSTLTRKLDEVGQKSVRARVALAGNKEALAQVDQLDAKIVGLDRRTGTGRVTVEGAARALADISAVNLALDKLGKKDVTPKIKILTDKASKLGFLQPSGIGTALASLPALIPLAGGIAGAVGAIGVSFGAATVAAGGFGIAAKSVLASASSDSDKLLTVQTSKAAKLSQLQIQLGAATTKAQKKQIESQIATVNKAANLQTATIKAGWTQSYSDVVDSLTRIKATWKDTSRSIASPVLLPWLDAVNAGMGFLKPLIGPVAMEFQAWGQAIDRYFKSKAGSTEIHAMAVSFGQFASLQLADIVSFIRDAGSGIHSLGHDLSADGVYLGAFGDYIAKWGTEFAAWSKSGKARADVQGFLGYIHQNGHLVVSIVRDLGKLLPGIFAGASATGQLELKAVGGLLSLIAKLPKGWQTGLTEAAGAILLLSKTGVLKVGFTVIGAAAGWVKKLIGGASVDLGAAGMQTAGDTMLLASRNMQEAAAAMAGGGAAGAGEGAAGGAAASAGGSAAEGGTMAALGAASVPVAVGIISGVAIAQLVNNDAASKASQAIASRVMKQNNLTPADIAAGKQTGGVVPGVPKSSIGSWKEYDGVLRTATGDQDKNALSQKAQAAAAQLALVRNQQLSATFRSKLIPDLQAMHANTPKVRGDVQNLADSILNTGNRSAATRGDRQKLITDLENAGVNARTATGFVNGLQKKIDAMHGKTVKVGVTETGVGHFTIAQVSSLSRPGGKLAGPLGSASGRLVTGGVPGRDSVLLAAMPGEVVVPTHMVRGGAVDHLRGMIPGFASGGYVGAPAGMLGPFTSAQESAFQSRVTGAMKSAMTAALRRSIRQAASSFGGFAGPGGGAPALNAALARRLFPSENFAAWNYVAMRESGWNQFALNPSSGAYGIAQALPPTKYPFAGQAAGGSNPTAQISWMESYMRGRYGGAAGAAAHELAYNWYDDPGGTWMPPGKSLAYNGTGRAEHLTPDAGMVPLLAEIADTLASIEAHTAAGPGRTGRALGDTLNGAARSSAYASMYGSR